MKRNIAKTLIFCLCLALALTAVSRVLMYKYPEGIGTWKEYYKEKADVDVILFGSSHVLRQVNPAVMFNEKGIAAYDIATGGEAIWTTYYSMEEALKYQEPEVVLVDIYMIFRDELYDDTHNIMGTFGMKRSAVWLKNIFASVPENKLYYITRYPLYHARYKNLSRDDFKSWDELYGNLIKGFLVDEHHWKTNKMPDISGMEYTDDTVEDQIPELSLEYIEKIVALAKEKNTKLVFIQTPIYTTAESAARTNQILDYVDNKNTFYWELNRDVKNMGLDNLTDFRDDNHLNWRGSRKLSEHLADRISEEFKVEDHRGQNRYDSYKEDYEYYEKIVEDFEKKGIITK